MSLFSSMKLAEDFTDTVHEPQVGEHKMCASIQFKIPQQRIVKYKTFQHLIDTNTKMYQEITNSFMKDDLFKKYF